MADDFYPFVDSGDPAPDNAHITGKEDPVPEGSAVAPDDARGERDGAGAAQAAFATRIAVYDDMLSTPRVIAIEPKDIRSYLEEITNTVYRCMKEQGGGLTLMVIREIVENFIHAHFVEPIISILDSGNTIRFADQGPGIQDKERAFEFGITSANREMKRYIRGTGAGFPMVQQYLEALGGAISIEDNLGTGTVVTVTIDPGRVADIEKGGAHGAAVRGRSIDTSRDVPATQPGETSPWGQPQPAPFYPPYPAYAPGVGAYIYPQAHHEFSTASQHPPQPANPYFQAAPVQGSGGEVYVSERGYLALSFMQEHGQAGPKELSEAFGQSGPTWSRELVTLNKQGLIAKSGQKYHLTELGGTWISSH